MMASPTNDVASPSKQLLNDPREQPEKGRMSMAGMRGTAKCKVALSVANALLCA